MVEPSTEERAREVADRYWDRLLELEPIAATQVGDDRFDDRLPDPSDEGIARRATVLESAWPKPGGCAACTRKARRRSRSGATASPGGCKGGAACLS